METSEQMETAQRQQAMATSVPAAAGRDHEIEEVMQFLQFSVKESSTFDGTILFKFKGEDDQPAMSYAVQVAEDRRVTTKKNATAQDTKVTCEVSISVDDFLWIYSGKASSSDILKLFYAGKLSISGYAFRKVSAFAQSFDFSSEKWRSFYSWRDENENARRSPSAVEEARNVGSPSRDFWFFHCRAILDRYNVSKLQQLQWETSMASVFGENYVLGNVCRAIQKTKTSQSAECHPHDSFYNAIASVLGSSNAVMKHNGIPQPRRALAIDHRHQQCDVQRELMHFFNPDTKHTSKYVESVCTSNHRHDLFGFFDEEYISAVKYTAKERFQQRRNKNRVDLADAGMAQLDKLVKVIGIGGHCNRTNNKQSKYIPAPEAFLREFNGSANVVMDLIKEKALGRKSLDKIPAPNVDFLFGGRTGNVLLVDDSRVKSDATKTAAEQVTGMTQSIVEVSRAPLQRRRSRRDFAVPKERLKAKFASLSRDLAKQNTAVISNVEEHLVFSDYL
ncbi:hypothetical protein FI667_g13711, partial [Globisporangium splendens]